MFKLLTMKGKGNIMPKIYIEFSSITIDVSILHYLIRVIDRIGIDRTMDLIAIFYHMPPRQYSLMECKKIIDWLKENHNLIRRIPTVSEFTYRDM